MFLNQKRLPERYESTLPALKNGRPIRLNIIKLPEKNPGKNWNPGPIPLRKLRICWVLMIILFMNYSRKIKWKGYCIENTYNLRKSDRGIWKCDSDVRKSCWDQCRGKKHLVYFISLCCDRKNSGNQVYIYAECEELGSTILSKNPTSGKYHIAKMAIR